MLTTEPTANTESCKVALPRERNHATNKDESATGNATPVQRLSLKALAVRHLQRNTPSNEGATNPQKPVQQPALEMRVSLTIHESIRAIRKAGFDLKPHGAMIVISPSSRLTRRQIQWLRQHKDELMEALTNERSVVPKLRQVIRFELKNGEGGGSCLGIPGEPIESVIAGLRRRYGNRLAEVSGGHIRSE